MVSFQAPDSRLTCTGQELTSACLRRSNAAVGAGCLPSPRRAPLCAGPVYAQVSSQRSGQSGERGRGGAVAVFQRATVAMSRGFALFCFSLAAVGFALLRFARLGMVRRSYLVVGLDVQLDLFAGQGADSVGWLAGCLRGCDGRSCWRCCLLDLHVCEFCVGGLVVREEYLWICRGGSEVLKVSRCLKGRAVTWVSFESARAVFTFMWRGFGCFESLTKNITRTSF